MTTSNSTILSNACSSEKALLMSGKLNLYLFEEIIQRFQVLNFSKKIETYQEIRLKIVRRIEHLIKNCNFMTIELIIKAVV
jgi:hypothetical protein